jgi:hypothetical protein
VVVANAMHALVEGCPNVQPSEKIPANKQAMPILLFVFILIPRVQSVIFSFL